MTLSLSTCSISLGIILLMIYAWLWCRPEQSLDALRRFPRSAHAGRILAAVALIWCGLLLYYTPLGPVEPYKAWLFAVVPSTILLVITVMPELLAVRALGGILVIIPTILLEAARWHESPWRLVITVFAYGMVLKGTAFICTPYWMRHGIDWAASTPTRWRLSIGTGTAISLLLLLLGLFVY